MKKWKNKTPGYKEIFVPWSNRLSNIESLTFWPQIKQLVVQAARQTFSRWRWICDNREKITYQQSMKGITSALNRDEGLKNLTKMFSVVKGLIGV